MSRKAFIQARRGDSTEWNVENPTLALGEFGYAVDTKEIKLGDGVTPWASLDDCGMSTVYQNKLDELDIGYKGFAEVDDIALLYNAARSVVDPEQNNDEFLGKFVIAKVNGDEPRMYTYNDQENTWEGLAFLKEVEELRGELNFYQEIAFDNVDNVVIDYSSFPVRPVIETWIEVGLGAYNKAEPVMTYDTTNQIVTVTFGGTYQSGYLILK